MKDIPGYEDLYAATEDGQIWSHRRQKFLKQSVDVCSYLTVSLCKDGNRKTCRVHKLIALTYIPNPDNLPVVDHIDRNKSNNSIENLRWVTVKENILNRDWEQYIKNAREAYYSIPKEIREEQLRKARQASARTRSRPIEMRDKDNHDILIKTYPSVSLAAIQEFRDVTKKNHISECANGKLKSAYGYFWTFSPVDIVSE